MGRAGLAAVAALAAVFVAGCGGTATPRFGSSPSASVSAGDPTTTAVSDPSPPVMPAAAKAHTAAGAKAFVRFVIDSLNYSETSLDSAALRPMFSPGCGGCTGVVEFVRGVKKDGGTLVGGKISGSDYAVTPLTGGTHELTSVSFNYHSTRQVVRRPGHAPKVYPDATAPLTLILGARDPGWQVTSWEAHR